MRRKIEKRGFMMTIFILAVVRGEHETNTKEVNITGIESLKSGTFLMNVKTLDSQMSAPYFMVPIEPDNAEMLAKCLRVDLDNTGDMFVLDARLLANLTQIKFSILSINQGHALTLVLNMIPKNSNPTTTSTTSSRRIVYSKTHYISSSSDATDVKFKFNHSAMHGQRKRLKGFIFVNCVNVSESALNPIDVNLFYASRMSANMLNTVNIYKLSIEIGKRANELSVKLECKNDPTQYWYNVKLVDQKDEEFVLLNGTITNVILHMVAERKRPATERRLGETKSTTTISSTFNKSSVGQTYQLNFKYVLISLIAILCLVIVLFYLTFMLVKKALPTTRKNSNNNQTVDVLGILTNRKNIDTTSSSDTPTTGDAKSTATMYHHHHLPSVYNSLAPNATCLSDNNANSYFKIDPKSREFTLTNQYLNRMGIGSNNEYSNSINSSSQTSGEVYLLSSLYKTIPGAPTDPAASGPRLNNQQWFHLLNWTPEFANMAGLFDEMILFK